MTDDKYVYKNGRLCWNPAKCSCPQNTSVIRTIEDNDKYVLAKILYKGKDECLAIRWHISDREAINKGKNDICLGYPSSRGYPTWMVLPDNLPEILLRMREKGRQ